jgi:hypothetical protein
MANVKTHPRRARDAAREAESQRPSGVVCSDLVRHSHVKLRHQNSYCLSKARTRSGYQSPSHDETESGHPSSFLSPASCPLLSCRRGCWSPPHQLSSAISVSIISPSPQCVWQWARPWLQYNKAPPKRSRAKSEMAANSCERCRCEPKLVPCSDRGIASRAMETDPATLGTEPKIATTRSGSK